MKPPALDVLLSGYGSKKLWPRTRFAERVRMRHAMIPQPTPYAGEMKRFHG